MNQKIIKAFIPIGAICISFIIGALLILAIGGNPIEAYVYLFQGAFGSSSNVSETIIKSVPLIFTGLAATFAYQCGVFNLGGEGQFAIGAIAGLYVSTTLELSNSTLLLALSLLAGMVAGGLWGLIPALLKITRGLNEIIVSILLNYIAIKLMGYLYSGPLREGNVPQTAAVSVRLGRLLPSYRFHVGIVIAVLVGIIIHYYLFHTAGGFRLRAVGMNATTSLYNGFPVKRLMMLSFIASGAIAGLGGSVELHGSQYRLMAGFGQGYGFDGVAIALIAQLNPLATVCVAYLFGVLRTGATTMQVGSGMPTSVIDIIEALVIVFAVAGNAWSHLPKIRQFLWTMQLRKEKAPHV